MMFCSFSMEGNNDYRVILALNESTRLASFLFCSPISFARPLAYLEHLARARAQNLLESADHHTALAGRVLKQTQRLSLGLGRLGVVDGRREQIWSEYQAVVMPGMREWCRQNEGRVECMDRTLIIYRCS